MDKAEAKIKANIAANAGKRSAENDKSSRERAKNAGKKARGGGTKSKPRAARPSDGRRAAGKAAGKRKGVGVTIRINKKGSSIAGALGYAEQDDKRHELVYSTAGNDQKDIINLFETLKSGNEKVKINVAHFTINLPEDTNFD